MVEKRFAVHPDLLVIGGWEEVEEWGNIFLHKEHMEEFTVLVRPATEGEERHMAQKGLWPGVGMGDYFDTERNRLEVYLSTVAAEGSDDLVPTNPQTLARGIVGRILLHIDAASEQIEEENREILDGDGEE